MNEQDQIRQQIQVVLGEMQYLIRLLYAVGDQQTRTLALQQLWTQTSYLQFLINLLEHYPSRMPAISAPGPAAAPNQPTVTKEQLAAATGRNGNPAYVAVNGIVYDVTNHQGWSNATHFGLPAGRDLTSEFASCHAGQQWILGTLKPVGRLA